MARIPPIAVSDELLTALTARAESERRTPSAMARVILEDALLPKPEPVPTLPDPGVPERRPKGLPRLPEPTVERTTSVHVWDPGPNGRCLHKTNGIVCNMPKRHGSHQ